MKLLGRLTVGAVAMLAIALAGCGSGQCVYLSEAPGGTVQGTLTYDVADGERASVEVSGDGMGGGPDPFYVNGTGDAIGLTGSFVDASGSTRDYVLTVESLSSGQVADIAGNGSVCFQRQTEGQPVCSPLAGTIVVQAISSTCDGTAGIYECAQTLQATLDATSRWEGTTFTLHATFNETGVSTATACGPD